MTIADEIIALDEQRKALADNILAKGVSAAQTETLTQLVPKVLQIDGGGGSFNLFGLINMGALVKTDIII